MSEEILKAISPLGLEASLAIEHHHAAVNDRHGALVRKLQQLEHEAGRNA